MEILELEHTDSTNNWIANHEKELNGLTLVYSYAQTAGRGQRGNSWESEPGKNITASIFFTPKNYEAARQFHISEAIALAIVDFLLEFGVEAKIKWPNDIYVGDRKICGILVEHSVIGRNISRTIAGFGINMNQTLFLSDAPNPVSLSMLTGLSYDINESVRLLSKKLEEYLEKLDAPEKLHAEFLELVWRKDGEFHDFFDRGRSERIKGKIEDVRPDGLLVVTTERGEKREYAFKEVEFILR